MIDRTLGHYQITIQPGREVHGEVYQAKDQRLGRDVAIITVRVKSNRDRKP